MKCRISYLLAFAVALSIVFSNVFISTTNAQEDMDKFFVLTVDTTEERPFFVKLRLDFHNTEISMVLKDSSVDLEINNPNIFASFGNALNNYSYFQENDEWVVSVQLKDPLLKLIFIKFIENLDEENITFRAKEINLRNSIIRGDFIVWVVAPNRLTIQQVFSDSFGLTHQDQV